MRIQNVLKLSQLFKTSRIWYQRNTHVMLYKNIFQYGRQDDWCSRFARVKRGVFREINLVIYA